MSHYDEGKYLKLEILAGYQTIWQPNIHMLHHLRTRFDYKPHLL